MKFAHRVPRDLSNVRHGMAKQPALLAPFAQPSVTWPMCAATAPAQTSWQGARRPFTDKPISSRADAGGQMPRPNQPGRLDPFHPWVFPLHRTPDRVVQPYAAPDLSPRRAVSLTASRGITPHPCAGNRAVHLTCFRPSGSQFDFESFAAGDGQGGPRPPRPAPPYSMAPACRRCSGSPLSLPRTCPGPGPAGTEPGPP